MNESQLQSVLARLASEYDGEALAAARMVVKLLAKQGKRPEDLGIDASGAAREVIQLRAQLAGVLRQIAALSAENASLRRMLQEREAAAAKPSARVRRFGSTPKQQAAFLLDNCEGLTQWEEGFLRDIIARDWRKLTDRQRAVMERIAEEKLHCECE
jgi:regulator of replication initiation timing